MRWGRRSLNHARFPPSPAQATSYLVTAWEALATQRETTMEELPVVFEDVSIVQAVQAQPGEAVTLSVLLDRSHRFQARARLAWHSEMAGCQPSWG